MKKILITIIGLLASGLSAVQAQAPFDYVPLKYSTSASKSTPDAYIKKLKPKYLTQNKDAIKDLNKFLYGVNLSHVANAKGKYYIEEVYVKKYLQNILDDLSAKNNFKEKYEVHCTRDISVNAYNMGDNRVYVNIGLLKLMTNEAQIAFLLAHELAHYLLLHVQEKFLASRDLRNSKKVKQEIKDIKKAKYNKTDLTVQLMKNYGYEFAKNDRKTERAADSMAVVLVSNTDYDLSEGIALMKILEDSDKDTISVDYPAFFDNKDFHLNRDWLKTNDKFLSFGDKKVVEFDKDSMSTHPAIPFRIEMIQKQMAAMGYSKTGKKLFVQSKNILDSIAYAAMMEEIEVYKKGKRYGAIVYHSLALLRRFPEHVFLHRNAIVALNEIITCMDKHTIQDHIPVEVDEFSIGYKHLLRLLDHTSSSELKLVFKNYIKNYYSKVSQYPEVKTIYEKIDKI